MAEVGKYLADDEEILLRSKGQSLEGDEFGSYHGGATLVATDRRLILLGSSGEFRDIDYSHVEGINSTMENVESWNDASAPEGWKFGWAFSSVFTILGCFGLLRIATTGDTFFGIWGTLALFGGAFGLYRWVSKRYDDVNAGYTKYTTTCRYGSGSKFKLVTREEIAPKLSSVVRSN